MFKGLSGSYNPQLGWGSFGRRIVGVHGTDTLNDLFYIYRGLIRDLTLLLEIHQLLSFILTQLLRIGGAIGVFSNHSQVTVQNRI